MVHFVDIQSSSGLLLISKVNSVSSYLEISVSFLSGYYSFNFGDSLPFADPLIVQSNFSVLIKGFLSSILVFGLPEVLIVLAIALLGKEVYGLLEQKLKISF